MIDLTDAEYIGSGSERAVYVHPENQNKLIKIIHQGRKNLQTKRETKAYKRLKRRLLNTDDAWSHLPKYYGECQTNLGKGQVVEAIRDYDNTISKTLQSYLEENSVSMYRHELDILKQYLLDNYIIINHDISSLLNIVVKRIDQDEFTLILVDALGDHTAIKLLNIIPSLARQKIERRWAKLEDSLKKFY